MTLILNTDPTRTTLLRRKFIVDMSKRFRSLQKAITELVVKDDVFGLDDLPGKVELRKEGLTVLQEPRAFQFLTNPQKVRAYQKWLQQQIDTKILTVDGMGKPWTATYIESAYKKGMLRAYTDANRLKLATDKPDFYLGSREQFLSSAFGQPELLSKIELLSLRAFDQLKGVTTTMSSQMSRILAEGLSRGDGSAKIARTLNKSVATLSRARSRMIARTEIINAHAEGQLDSFEMQGIKEVGAIVEFSTAGDERVCAECSSMEGEIFTIDKARGMIPLHPNCRCAWIPAEQVSKKKRQSVEKEFYQGEGLLTEKEAIAKGLKWEHKKITKKPTIKPKSKPKSKDITQEQWERALSEQEQDAIYRFTGVGGTDILEYQIGRKGYRLADWEISKAKSRIATLNNMLKKAPKYKGTVYRGVDVRISDLNLSIGDITTTKSFTSSTTLQTVAKEYAENKGSIFVIQPKSGVNISKFSFQPEESEILFSKGVKFKVTKIQGNKVFLSEI